MLVLGIESTCDETAAAVVRDGREVLCSIVASQVDLHARYGGVVPEIASRAHIEKILPVIEEALGRASVSLSQLDAVAVAHRPGLIGSLLIGVTAAKTLAWATGKPLIGVDHVHAHLWSVMLRGGDHGADGRAPAAPPSPPPSPAAAGEGVMPQMPAVGMVVSGGHTALYHLRSWQDVRLVGTTIDDAVGEAYDKVAAILHLPYPGGPAIDALAQQGDENRFDFPRPLLGKASLDFSFSGLKTAVLYHVRGVPGRDGWPDNAKQVQLDAQRLRDTAASFQAACRDTLIEKLRRAARRFEAKSVIIGGGVAANSALRKALSNMDLPAFMPEAVFCTDNAAMVAGLAWHDARTGGVAPLDLDAVTYSAFRDRSAGAAAVHQDS
jgi:N6-L-threonylcarbamoyladenine synthase